MADEAKPEDAEENDRTMPKDILALSRITRMLKELPENERTAIVGYLKTKYLP